MFSSNGCSVPLVASLDGGNGSGNNNGWGDGSWIWIILVFALIWNNGFGGWGNGNNGGGAGTQGAITRTDLCGEFSFQDVKNGIRELQSTADANFRTIDNAVCTLGYNNAQLANGIQMQVANGFGTLDTSLCQLGNNVSQQLNAMNIANMQNANAANVTALQNANALQSQISGCCCDLRAGQAEAKFQAAQDTCAITSNASSNTRDILENANANTRAILDKLTAQEIAAKDAQIAAQNQQIFGLQLAASQSAQNEYLVSQLSINKCPVPAYVVPNPNCCYGTPYGVLGNSNGVGAYNGGCSCA